MPFLFTVLFRNMVFLRISYMTLEPQPGHRTSGQRRTQRSDGEGWSWDRHPAISQRSLASLDEEVHVASSAKIWNKQFVDDVVCSKAHFEGFLLLVEGSWFDETPKR